MNRDLAFGEFVEGTHELSKMNLRRSSGNRSEYPLVTPLLTGLDRDQLFDDYKKCLHTLSSNYIGDRKNLLGCSLEEAAKELERYGFNSSHYRAYGLMQVGRPEWLDSIPEYTREVLGSLKDDVCRAHYAVAQPGWDCAFHIDTHHFRTQGFRLNLPINAPAYYVFRVDGKELEFRLEPGTVWMINAAFEHKGMNPGNVERVAIICQLMGDAALFKD